MKTLIDRIGADRFVIGSDFPVGERDPAGFVKNIPGIADEAYRLIASENATKILAR
jgi:predicted TIM-barrel fold metal-dependent hydrolase